MYYLVKMYRWGDLEEHSYSAGCFSKESRAKYIGEKERDFRGGKYEHVISVVQEVPDGVVLNEVDEWLSAAIKKGIV